MWEVIVMSCWLGIPIASLIAEMRHIADADSNRMGWIAAPAWTIASGLGLFWSGWFVIVIFVLAAALAALPRSEERIASQRASETRRMEEIERQLRREERSEIDEDYRLGLIDADEYEQQLRDAGFRQDNDDA